jgi:hypothetical protein
MPDLFTEFFKPDKAQARSMKPKLEKNQARPGLPDGFFQTKNPNLAIFWRALEWKILLHILVVSTILLPLGIFCGQFVIL